MIILLDLDIYLHRACSVATTSVTFDDVAHSEVNLKHAETWFRNEMAKLRDRLKSRRIIMAAGDRHGNFRKELFPGYKINRTGGKPPGFVEFEARVEKRCEVVREERLEGDDILGLLATKMKDTVIVTIDKDLAQIPGRLYNPDTDTLRTVEAEEGDTLLLTQTLTGDRVDGYPGCPGVGPVTAAKILDGDPETRWDRIVKAFEKKGLTEDDALLQARLAFILRQGYYDRSTKTVTLWTPETQHA